MIYTWQTSTTNISETYRYEKTPIQETCLLSIIFAVQMIYTWQTSTTNVSETYGYEKTPIQETCLLSIKFCSTNDLNFSDKYYKCQRDLWIRKDTYTRDLLALYQILQYKWFELFRQVLRISARLMDTKRHLYKRPVCSLSHLQYKWFELFRQVLRMSTKLINTKRDL